MLGLLAEGLRDSEIAVRLKISTRTAECHVQHLLRKLDLRNRSEAAAYAIRHGLVADEWIEEPPAA